MTAHYESKHGQVLRSREELFMAFTDMRNFTRMIPEQAQAQVSLDADFDNLWATVQNFKIGVKIDERLPYSVIRLISTDSPVEFVGALHFDQSPVPGRTEFYVVLDANLNMMMRAMLGRKIQEALDKMVQGLVDVSEGKMPDIPEGML